MMNDDASQREEAAPITLPPSETYESIARIAGQTLQPFQLFAGEADTAKPWVVSAQRFNGFSLQTLSRPGADLIDYQALPEGAEALNNAEDGLPAMKAAGVDLIYLRNCLAPIPRHLKPYAISDETLVFDPSLSEKGWGFITNRKSIKRDTYKAERELGGLYAKTFRGKQAVEDWAETVEHFHIERWRFDRRESEFSRSNRADQYNAFGDQAVVTVVFAGDDDPMAIHLGLEIGDALLFHTVALNIRYLNWSPLKMLVYFTCEMAEQHGYTQLDFGVGLEPYKYGFTNAKRTIHTLIIPVSAKGRALLFARRYLGLNCFSSLVKTTHQRFWQLARWGWDTLHRLDKRILYFEAPKERGDSLVNSEITFRHSDDWGDVLSWHRASNLPLFRKQYERIKAGEVFVCLCSGDDIVSYGWMSAKTRKSALVAENGKTLNLDGIRMLYDFTTPEAHRRCGYYTQLLAAIIGAFTCERLIIYVRPTNTPSVSAIQKVGMVPYTPSLI